MISIPLFHKRSFWIVSFLLLATAIIFFEKFVVHSPQFVLSSSRISLAVTVDMLVIVPLLWYVFMVRKAKLPLVSVMMPLVACFVIASAMLPAAQHQWLGYFEKVLALAELLVLGYTVIKIRQVISAYKQASLLRNDFIFNLNIGLEKVLGKSLLTRVFVSEISVVRYGLLGWRKPREVQQGQPFFSIHQTSGYGMILVAITMVLVAETSGFHFLIRMWSPVAALIATLSSVYFILFILADYVAIVKRPIAIVNDLLAIRVGLRCNADVPLSHIKSITKIRNYKNDSKEFFNARLIGCSPNVLIELSEPVLIKGLYGKGRMATVIALNIDDCDALYKQVFKA